MPCQMFTRQLLLQCSVTFAQLQFKCFLLYNKNKGREIINNFQMRSYGQNILIYAGTSYIRITGISTSY
jgi:hypothetical protein